MHVAFWATVASLLLVLSVGVAIVADRRWGTLLWQDSVVYAAPRPGAHPSTAVPRRIFQTWKTAQLRPYQQESQDRIKRHYPEWEYELWTDDMIDAFVAEHWSAFYRDTWSRLTPFIKKVDTVRYMWMYTFGGLYMDIDYMVERPITPLLTVSGAAYIPTRRERIDWQKDDDASSPVLVASVPHHPFWLAMLEYIAAHHTPEYLQRHPREEVIVATGPAAMGNVLLAWHRAKRRDPLVLLSECRMGVGDKWLPVRQYGYHENRHRETWRHVTARA